MREKRKLSQGTALEEEKKKYEEIMARLDKYKDNNEQSITDRVAI